MGEHKPNLDRAKATGDNGKLHFACGTCGSPVAFFPDNGGWRHVRQEYFK